MSAKKNLLLVLPLALLILSACSITTTSSGGTNSNDGSVFLSLDKGDTWRLMTATPSVSGQPGNINDLSVNVMSIDPEDNLAVYLGTTDSGLYYTYAIGSGWNFVSGLPKAAINDVQVDPKNKCIIYAAIANRVYRSADCSRTWTQVYFDNNAGVSVKTIVVDHYNSQNLYIGTSRGDIIKSIDAGAAWRTIQRLEEGIARLVMSPTDSRQLYVATVKSRIFSFISNTLTDPANSADLEQNFLVENWTDLNDVLKSFDLSGNFRDLLIASSGQLFVVTDKVVLRSPDGGVTWENIKLVPPEKDATINALVVNPNNALEMYYVTNTTFFRSLDGGATWMNKKLPTARLGHKLLVDFNNPSAIYLGTWKLK